MKITLAFIILLFFVNVTYSQTTNPNFDAELAEKLNADDYGMKQYILVILKTGENKTASKEESNEAFRGHMENIGRLVKEGKLIVAGPLGKNDQTYRGIFIFDVPTIEEARELVTTDPAVKANLLAADLYECYGSAALAEYLPVSEKIWKIQP
jgi:uncharacterized protein YciI